MADGRRLTGPSAPGASAGKALVAARGVGRLLATPRVDPALALLVPLLLLGLWHLDRYPRTWFDEGMYLQVARNFARDGLYAVRSADGTIDYAPIIGVGPTVLMPAALAVQLGGATLGAVRVVPVLALLLATALLYLLARGLFGRLAAGCTLLVLMSLPALDWVATGRQLLGEVPAIALLLAGGLLAWRAPAGRAPLAGGLLLGLTLMTKGQYLLILPPTICAVAFFDRAVTRQRPIRWYAWLLGAALLTYAAWFFALLAVLNHGQIAENFRQLRASSGGALLIINRDRMLAGLRFLLGPRAFFLVLPATVAGLWLAWRATGPRRLALAALWIFQTLWLGWFACASIAWPRYAFPGLVINTIFIGVLVARCVELTRDGLRARAWRWPNLAAAVATVLLAALVARGAGATLAPIALADQREPQQFARDVERLVPPGAVVDAWEPEIGFLIDRPIQHPPLGTLDRVVRASWLGPGPGRGAPVDLSADLRGDYLVVGPFARWVGVYNTAVDSPGYRLIARVGEYELYRRIGTGAAHQTGE